MQDFHGLCIKKILYVAVLSVTCFASGCLLPPASDSGPTPTPAPPTPTPTPPEDAKIVAIANSLSDARKEDCVKMYGVFTAFSKYVENGHKGIETTKQMLDVWKETLNNLGWNNEQYPKFTDAVESELKSRGLEDPKPMSEAKTSVVEAFELIAAGCKHAALNAE
jgi:hypothetical protein